MSKKSFLVSAAGLKNVVFANSFIVYNFRFTLGEKEILLNNFLADFISPRVSEIHKIDPTIDTLCLNNFFSDFAKIDDLFDPDLITNIKLIASGQRIEIDEEMGHKIRLFSILLGNEEIFNSMNDIYPINTSRESLDSCLKYLQCFVLTDKTGNITSSFNNQSILDFVSSHFYLIDESKLLNLHKSVIYSIVTNRHLKICSEDSLFDFINKLFSIENDQDLNIIEFYEALDISALSEAKFKEFIDVLNPNEITQNLWGKLKKCFSSQSAQKTEKCQRYSKKQDIIDYDNNSSNQFKGIIFHLGNGNPKSVIENGAVDITSSPILSNNSGHAASHVVDFDNDSKSFLSDFKENSWLTYDFKNRKVRPSSYSIKSHHWGGKGNYHPKSWCIEGSNDNEHWKTLDSCTDEKCLDGKNLSKNFPVKNNLDVNEYYRYLRIRQTDVNTRNDHLLGFSSLEYFGSILEPNQ